MPETPGSLKIILISENVYCIKMSYMKIGILSEKQENSGKFNRWSKQNVT